MKPKKKKVFYVNFLIHSCLYNLANVCTVPVYRQWAIAMECRRVVHTLRSTLRARRVFSEYYSTNIAECCIPPEAGLPKPVGRMTISL